MSDKHSITIFAGKGGVGKTTCAAATAFHHSSLGEKTLAISTDATPSLSHIFEIADGTKPAKIRESLYINEVGLQQVKEMWDKKFGREVYEVFSSFVSIEYDDFVDFMTSLLPGLSDEFMVERSSEDSVLVQPTKTCRQCVHDSAWLSRWRYRQLQPHPCLSPRTAALFPTPPPHKTVGAPCSLS